jgi:hypothetical protein
LINEGLGHRNFNEFLNHHRIDDAKAALNGRRFHRDRTRAAATGFTAT